MKKKKLFNILDKLTDDLIRSENCCTLYQDSTPKAIAVNLVFNAYAVLDRHYNLNARYKEEAISDLKLTLKRIEGTNG